MNPMLELSMDADYDILAACLIIASVLAARFWFSQKLHAKKHAE